MGTLPREGPAINKQPPEDCSPGGRYSSGGDHCRAYTLEVEGQDTLGAHRIIFPHACAGHKVAQIPVPCKVVIELPFNLEINFRSELVGRTGIAILLVNLLGCLQEEGIEAEA